MMHRFVVAIFGLVVCASGQSLRKIAVIDLPGPKGQRFDYLTIDDEDQYLLSAHLGRGVLHVIDMRTNRLVKSIQVFKASPGLSMFPDCTRFTRRIGGRRKSA